MKHFSEVGATICRTTKINEATLFVTITNKDLERNKKGQPFKNVEASCDVEISGVETVVHIRG